MTDVVLDFGTIGDFERVLRSVSLWREKVGLVLAGPITWVKLSKGSGFLNIVGPVSDPTGNMLPVTGPDGSTFQVPEMGPPHGYWVRIRWNGDMKTYPKILAGVTVYPEKKLLTDGTPDPAYVQPPYGMIL